jgi:hypothetical protein
LTILRNFRIGDNSETIGDHTRGTVRYYPSMNLKAWLRERHRTLLAVGLLVPVLITLTFWSVIRSEWPFWLACYVVGFPAGVFVVWGRNRLSDVFSRLTKSQRMLLRCIALVALWCLLVLFEHDLSEANWITAAVALFWGGYVLFSRVVDSVWSHIRRR